MAALHEFNGAFNNGKYKIPVIELILNNNVLGMVRQWQRMFYDKRFQIPHLIRTQILLCLLTPLD